MPPVAYNLQERGPRDIDWGELVSSIGEARGALGEYKWTIGDISNDLLEPLAYNEALASSYIEGIHSSFLELLEYRAAGTSDESTHQQGDHLEVLNCHVALQEAAASMKEGMLSERILKDAHKRLMQSSRGRDKDPGNYRRVQNWIGRRGTSIEQATYVPCPTEQLGQAMKAWSDYIQGQEVDPVIQMAIMHAEFEAIHPFLDGNGRVGRLLIPLFLKAKGVIASPIFGLAEQLAENRGAYYSGLLAVSTEKDWTGWCRFFLQAVIDQVSRDMQKVNLVRQLYQERKDWVLGAVRSKYGTYALDWTFRNPVFTAPEFVEGAGIPRNTARRILENLQSKGMLIEHREGKGRRAAMLAFPELVNIYEDRKVL